jgi:hypothetical protein
LINLITHPLHPAIFWVGGQKVLIYLAINPLLGTKAVGQIKHHFAVLWRVVAIADEEFRRL